MRITLLLLSLLVAGAAWGQPPGSFQTLAERLNLEAVASLEIVSSKGDATHANYRLVSPQGVRPVLGAVERKLLAGGWVSHPNLNEGMPGGSAPNALLPDNRGRQLHTFVQGEELLEVLAAPVGRSTFVSLQLNLISVELERPVAALPDASL